MAEDLLHEPRDLPTERLERILSGEEDIGLLDRQDVVEEVLRRQQMGFLANGFPPIVVAASFLLVFSLLAFFGWTLYKSLKEKEKKREEKKKLKQKKKK